MPRPRTRATFAEPRQRCAGIDYVMVNGVLVIDDGSHSGHLPGHAPRRTAEGTR
jgi:N-acyl-D-amino-acid deacylase